MEKSNKLMKPIKTPKGLENYTWGSYGTLNALKEKHPNIKLFKTVIRKSDGVKFKSGQWVELNDGEQVQIIAFDKYNYPLPVKMCGDPIDKYHSNNFITTVWKSKYKKITRAIYSWTLDFIFCDLEEYKWLKK